MRYYSTTAGEMVLQTAVSSSDTLITVSTTAGLPASYPYTLILDYGTTAEEVVDVTAASGTTLTVTRGRDGTTAQSHDFGAKIRHGVTARDFRESRDHEAATAAHGVGEVAGVTETQTLENKTLDDGTLSGTTTATGDVVVKDGVATAAQVGGAATRAAQGATAYVRQMTAASSAVKVEGVINHTVPPIDISSTLGTPGSASLRVSFYNDVTLQNSTLEAGGSVGGIKFRNGYTGSGKTEGQTDLRKDGSLRVRQQSGGLAGVGNVALDVQGGDKFSDTDPKIAVFRNKSGTEVASINADGTLSGPTVTALDGRVGALETNLGSQTTFAATSASKNGKRLHWQTASVGTGDAGGWRTVTIAPGFDPSVVLVQMPVALRWGVDPDPAQLTSTSFRLQVLQTDGTAYASWTGTVMVICGE